MNISAKILKYSSIAGIEFRSMTAYLLDQVISLVFMAVVMFVFVALWRTTYATVGKATIDGFALNEMIWYLVGTESIVLSLPRIYGQISQEVRGGDIALRLCKPYSFLLYHFARSAGVGLFRFFIALGIGGTVAWAMVGGLDFDWRLLPIFILLYLLTQSLHYCYTATIGLVSFWTEDATGLWFLLDRLKWMLGGLLLPLEVFPKPIQLVASWLPFRAMLYDPARLFVRFSWHALTETVLLQLFWLAALGLLVTLIFRTAVRRIETNGG